MALRGFGYLLLFLAGFCGSLLAHADATIYRYQDSSGRWVFSDSKPKTGVRYYQMSYATTPPPKSGKSASSLSAPAVKVTAPAARPDPGPVVATEPVNGRSWLAVRNPFFAPIEVELTLDSPVATVRRVIPAQSKQYVQELPSGQTFKYQWKMGDPAAVADGHIYQPPVAKSGIYKISQAFNGNFSHNRPGNRYAIDIPMPVGTPVVAARAGVVTQVVDTFGSGGGSVWMRSQTNFITVLHADGTFGVYAHLMAASARVRPGEAVVTGQALAASGNSGYSTGPHLHFAVRRNGGMVLQSIPFNMSDSSGLVSLVKGGQLNVRREGLLSANP